MAHDRSTNGVGLTLEVLKPQMQRGISLPARMSWESWLEHEQIRAEKVELYRKYVDGNHEVELSKEMKAALRLQGDDVFSINHCENIVETLADRLRVAGVQASHEESPEDAQAWVDNLLRMNRFDGMQVGLFTDSIRDGMGYVMAEYNPDLERVVWHVEPAFDGHSGMLVIYGDDQQRPSLAIKIWHEIQIGDKSQLLDRIRVNLYFADHIEKYVFEDGRLDYYTDETGAWSYAWVDGNGDGLGVAVVPFPYKRPSYDKHGLGRLDNVIPIQRTANRTLVSMVGVAETLGFPIRYSLGAPVPTVIQPGTWIEVVPPTTKTVGLNSVPLSMDERSKLMDEIGKIQLGQLPMSNLEGLMSQLNYLIGQMYIVSGTPYPEGTGANMSGEALKQLDIRLVGTANRCQVGYGNALEDLVMLSARIDAYYGSLPFASDALVLSTRWESAEVRDDKTVIANVKETVGIIGDNLDLRTRLELVASVWNWDKARIDAIVERVSEASALALSAELGVGGFDRFVGNG